MMGVLSQGPVYYDLFEEFAELATRGMCPLGAPDGRGHKDGWGIACFEEGKLELHVRDVGSAADSSKFYGAAWKIAKRNIERSPGHTVIVLSHLRRASAGGPVAAAFAHPFVETRGGIMWAFQHNGSLVKETGRVDKIDSQLVFEGILEHLDGRDHADVASAVKWAREDAIRSYRGFTGLNLMLSDGQALHVYRDYQTNGEYYTLYLDNFGELIIASSEPILAMSADPITRGVVQTVTPDLQIQRTTIA